MGGDVSREQGRTVEGTNCRKYAFMRKRQDVKSAHQGVFDEPDQNADHVRLWHSPALDMTVARTISTSCLPSGNNKGNTVTSRER